MLTLLDPIDLPYQVDSIRVADSEAGGRKASARSASARRQGAKVLLDRRSSATRILQPEEVSSRALSGPVGPGAVNSRQARSSSLRHFRQCQHLSSATLQQLTQALVIPNNPTTKILPTRIWFRRTDSTASAAAAGASTPISSSPLSNVGGRAARRDGE
jgi:hypothetical protein